MCHSWRHNATLCKYSLGKGPLGLKCGKWKGKKDRASREDASGGDFDALGELFLVADLLAVGFLFDELLQKGKDLDDLLILGSHTSFEFLHTQ